jgi:hypothetical protein
LAGAPITIFWAKAVVVSIEKMAKEKNFMIKVYGQLAHGVCIAEVRAVAKVQQLVASFIGSRASIRRCRCAFSRWRRGLVLWRDNS